ncbi:MAG TPA: GNAT family N-acetyltransferase [Candidatus Dormibacteraeota bacterium]|nr:GNAT family N-acetyltransferase [Candidatus Dormibacteraeota bacterium]
MKPANAGALTALLDRDIVEGRFARGCRCFVVWMGGEIGGYGWLATNPEWVNEIGGEVRPGPLEGYIWNCFTVPKHRRKGVFRSLLIGISNIAHDEGLRRLWIGSVAIPAEKAVGPSGFRPAITWAGRTFAGRMLSVAWARDRALARDATAVLRGRPGIHFYRLRPRRH